MQSMHKYILLVVLGLAVIPAGIWAFDWFSPIQKTELKTNQSALCEAHGLEAGQCPFCDSSLIETQGFCAGHGVPEALCHRCQSGLEAAFRKQGDWCGGHDLPESQCEICNPGVLDKYRKNAGHPDAQAGVSGESGDTSFFDDFDDAGDMETFPRYKKSPAIGCTTQPWGKSTGCSSRGSHSRL